MNYIITKEAIDKIRSEITDVLISFELPIDTDPCIMLLDKIEMKAIKLPADYEGDELGEPHPLSVVAMIFISVLIMIFACIGLFEVIAKITQ